MGYLKESNGSLVRLSEEIGVSKRALFDWMNGKSLPTRKHALAILKITRVDPETLVKALDDNFKQQRVTLLEGLKEA